MKPHVFCLSIILGPLLFSDAHVYAQSRYRFRVRDNMHQDIERTLQNSPWKTPVYEVFVRSFDGLYVPAVLIKPGDDSAKHAVIILLYAGSRGMGQLHKDLSVNRGMLAERLLQEGYAVCNPGYRVEMDDTYVDPNFPAVLDHHDVMAVIEYLKRRSDIDPGRIGLYGVSHGGELICKITAAMNLAGAVAVEPANIDFLNYKRVNRGEIEQRRLLTDAQFDRGKVMERIRQIRTPLVIINRTNDHLTGIFKTTYQLMRQAGVPCWEWEFEHPRHGFSWGPRKKNGAYDPDTVQQKALEQTIEFFNTYVRKTVRDRSKR
jgi:dipeptidyl aminopeptidase/acylaminoacyl peptidase